MMRPTFVRHATVAFALTALSLPAARAQDGMGGIRPPARPAEVLAGPAPAPGADGAASDADPAQPAGSAAASLFASRQEEAADVAADTMTRLGLPQPDPAPAQDGAILPEGEAMASLAAHIRPQSRPELLESPEGAEPVAACLSPASIPDRDLARNAGAFAADPDLCISQEKFVENGRPWHLVIIENRARKRGPVWALPHDNEDSAFDAGLYAVSRYGGKLVAVEAQEGRSFQKQDPNRNFGATKAVTGPCTQMSPKPSPAFTKAISRHFTKRFPVLTMHSNDNGHAAAGGAGHISAARSSATMTGIMSRNPKRGLSDEDNAVLTAGLVPLEANRKAQQLVAHMDALGINVIYEHVRADQNDCSFSYHALLTKMGDYYNIEVEHGRVAEQKAILDALMDFLGVPPRY